MQRNAQKLLFLLLFVIDLKLDRYDLGANPGMGVAVTCSTKREGDLQWRGLDGNAVTQTRHTRASNATGGVQSLTLLITEVTAANVGDYQCWFQPKEGEKRTPETFTLRLKQCRMFVISQLFETFRAI